jgi:hypothetical protein
MNNARHLFKHLVLAFQKHELERSYQRSLMLHTLKEELASLEKKLEDLKHKEIDRFRVGLLKQKIDKIKHLFP